MQAVIYNIGLAIFIIAFVVMIFVGIKVIKELRAIREEEARAYALLELCNDCTHCVPDAPPNESIVIHKV